VSFEFLSTAGTALARSPMERQARASGAVIEQREGWNVATGFGDEEAERERVRSSVGFADASQLGKIEVQADPATLEGTVASCSGGLRLELGTADRAEGAWWCPFTPRRALVLAEAGATAALRARLEDAAAAANGLASVIDLTSALGALRIVGPLARETFARFTAIDLRPRVTPVGGFRPGSVARGPGAILREDEERYVMLFGAALGQYMWTVVEDAAAALGGGPVGEAALGA
jgi:heterotetrameric sarcosine oxidase gamma subunit